MDATNTFLKLFSGIELFGASIVILLLFMDLCLVKIVIALEASLQSRVTPQELEKGPQGETQ